MALDMGDNLNVKVEYPSPEDGTADSEPDKKKMRLAAGPESSVTLWQFLLELLVTNDNRDIICWTNNEGEFKLLDAERVAKLWGFHKNKDNMNYDKLSRALRYYYDKNIIKKVMGQKFVYKFVSFPEVVKKQTQVPFKTKMQSLGLEGSGEGGGAGGATAQPCSSGVTAAAAAAAAGGGANGAGTSGASALASYMSPYEVKAGLVSQVQFEQQRALYAAAAAAAAGAAGPVSTFSFDPKFSQAQFRQQFPGLPVMAGMGGLGAGADVKPFPPSPAAGGRASAAVGVKPAHAGVADVADPSGALEPMGAYGPAPTLMVPSPAHSVASSQMDAATRAAMTPPSQRDFTRAASASPVPARHGVSFTPPPATQSQPLGPGPGTLHHPQAQMDHLTLPFAAARATPSPVHANRVSPMVTAHPGAGAMAARGMSPIGAALGGVEGRLSPAHHHAGLPVEVRPPRVALSPSPLSRPDLLNSSHHPQQHQQQLTSASNAEPNRHTMTSPHPASGSSVALATNMEPTGESPPVLSSGHTESDTALPFDSAYGAGSRRLGNNESAGRDQILSGVKIKEEPVCGGGQEVAVLDSSGAVDLSGTSKSPLSLASKEGGGRSPAPSGGAAEKRRRGLGGGGLRNKPGPISIRESTEEEDEAEALAREALAAGGTANRLALPSLNTPLFLASPLIGQRTPVIQFLSMSPLPIISPHLIPSAGPATGGPGGGGGTGPQAFQFPAYALTSVPISSYPPPALTVAATMGLHGAAAAAAAVAAAGARAAASSSSRSPSRSRTPSPHAPRGAGLSASVASTESRESGKTRPAGADEGKETEEGS